MVQNPPSGKYKGILFMLMAALGFSVMGGFAKMLQAGFNAPQLVFYRNITGLAVLLFSFARFPVRQTGGKPLLLIFRGLMGTIALYTLLYNILHISLGTALTYNTTNTIFIALLSFWVLNEKLSPLAWACIVVGFIGVMLINKPSAEVGWKYHMVGLVCGISSSLAYLSVSSLNKYYDTRVIVLFFLLSGVALPLLGMLVYGTGVLPPDGLFVSNIRLPQGIEWAYILGMGITALLGQYCVTKAFGYDKAGIVSAIGYSNIVFGIVIGVILGDLFPDLQTLAGIALVVLSGTLISLSKK